MAGAEGYGLQFFEIVQFSDILMFHRKIFGLLMLVKIKVLNFIGKFVNLALSLLYRCNDASAWALLKP